MMDKSVCLEFLRLVFPELHICDIEINAEQTMENQLGKRGIRLDIYIEDKGAQRVIDMEMQVSDDSAELPKRTRYYSSTIDGWLLNRSEDYENLCDTIILFVCPFDPFKRGQKIYTFEHICREEPTLTLQDGQRIRFLNTVGVKGSISKELQAVFDYITSDDREAEDRFAKKLKEMVSEINADAERIGVVMTFEEELQHELRHNDSIWKRRLEEKEALLEEKTALLEQNAISLEQKDSQLSEQTELIKKQDGIIADLKRQIEALKKGRNPRYLSEYNGS
jgi:predicted transposase/invertase (TIGR01784 family)